MKKKLISYKDSGVDINSANNFTKHIAKFAKKDVQNSSNLNNIGSFNALFDISKLNIKDPVIVSCTDGVGTKLDLSEKFNKLQTIGIDLVAMCVNDLIVQGARPLFF